MASKLIGILAGMGPKSTAPFVDLVIRECELQYGATLDTEFPPLLIYSLPCPLYLDRPVDHEAVKATVLGGLRKLEANGVDFIAMPCNTAHLYHEELAAGVDVPLLNIVEEAARALPENTRRLGLLATRLTAESGLYHRRLSTVGVEVVDSPARQERVDELLGTIKSPDAGNGSQGLWDELMAEAAGEGLDAVLVACTDLNALDTRSTQVQVVDATRSLAAATVREWRSRSS